MFMIVTGCLFRWHHYVRLVGNWFLFVMAPTHPLWLHKY